MKIKIYLKKDNLPCLDMQVKFFRQVSPPEADDGHVKEI
jgi:hypothetical protein